MDFLQLCEARWSVRRFKPEPVPQDKLARILRAAQAAPTACNYQAFRIYLCAGAESREKLKAVSKCTFDAPLVLVICYNADREWKNPMESGIHSGEQDASIAACHIMLEAWECGIGCCWVNLFPNTLTAVALGLPDNMRPVLLMPMGIPADDAAPLPLHAATRPLEELVEWL